MGLLVSIIVPSYRPTPERAELAMESLAEIHGTGIPRKEYELIVVDNGGIPLGPIDADVVVSSSINLGQAVALNVGVEISRAKVLALMDDDLGYKKNWLRAGYRILKLYPWHVISLRDFDDRYTYGYTDEGHRLSRKVGGCWILSRRIIRGIGRFSRNYGFGGIYTRGLLRAGFTFIIAKDPYIFHRGAGLTIGGHNPYERE